jgi:hypothetical protein
MAAAIVGRQDMNQVAYNLFLLVMLVGLAAVFAPGLFW